MSSYMDKIKADVEAKRQQSLASKPAEPATPDYSEFIDAVPDSDSEDTGMSPVVQDKQSFIDKLSIITVAVKFGSAPPKVYPGQTESIMVNCVNPGHEDKKPSAWVNTVKNTYYCPVCEAGGGPVAVAAIFDGNLNTQHGNLRGKAYSEAEDILLKMFDWTKSVGSGGVATYLPPTPEELKPVAKHKPELILEPEPEPKLASVTDLLPESEPEEELQPYSPRLESHYEWRSYVPKDTFLRDYMEAACMDNSTEVYHLGYALLGLGCAVGERVTLNDRKEILLNENMVMVGETGDGKSISGSYIKGMLRRIAPFDNEEEPQTGVRIGLNANSAQGLVTILKREIIHPPSGKTKGYKEERGNVKAIVDFPEMESLVKMFQYDFNIRTFVHQLFDGDKEVGTISKEGGHYSDRAFCSVVSTLQPSIIQDLLSKLDANQGTLNRFLFLAGTAKKPDALGTTVGPSSFLESLLPAEDKLRQIHEWSVNDPKLLLWSSEAESIYKDWHSKIWFPAKRESPMLLGRGDMHIKKITGLFSVNSMHEKIEAEDVMNAIAMWPWIKATYSLIGNEIGNTQGSVLEEKILHHIRLWEKNPKNKNVPMPRGLLNKKINNNGVKEARADINKALDTLERSQELKKIDSGCDWNNKPLVVKPAGQPTEKWRTA